MLTKSDIELIAAFKVSYICRYFGYTSVHMANILQDKIPPSSKFIKKLEIFKKTHTIGKNLYADLQQVAK
jgi:hypothetical protein